MTETCTSCGCEITSYDTVRGFPVDGACIECAGVVEMGGREEDDEEFCGHCGDEDCDGDCDLLAEDKEQ